MSEKSSRRQFLDRSLRIVGLAGIGGAAAILGHRAAANSVFQIDPAKCAACDLCRTSCVLSHSAVKAVNEFSKCGYCQLCPAYYDVTSQPDEMGLPTGRVCPQDALKRRIVGKVDEEDPNNNYYEYTVDESLCDGCGKCVKECKPPAGNGALRLEVRYAYCLECASCSIQRVCPENAVVLVPTPGSRRNRRGMPGRSMPKADKQPDGCPGQSRDANQKAMDTSASAFSKPRSFQARIILLVLLISPVALHAQYQKAPPDFGDTYRFPTPAHPEPTPDFLRFLDVGLLALALGLAAWLVYKRRSRAGLTWVSLFSVVYFGFYRKGCICSVGAIQNVVLCLVSPEYYVSFSVIAVFFLPLTFALLFGRVFCSGVCPLGAIQDLVILRPLRVPLKLDKALRRLQYVYLALAVLFAGWGLQLALGSWEVQIGRRFLICDYDPFIPIFRRSGPFYMVAVGAAFVFAGMFIGRPYCRWLCPYGGILALLSRVSWKNVSITPDKELNCGLCADACPAGAIEELRADRAWCMACARCYEYCPRQKRLMALRAGPKKPSPAPAVPGRWVSVARCWTGIASLLVAVLSTGWLLGAYVSARYRMAADSARVASLREQAMNDSSVQEILKLEWSRQHDAAVARRKVYNRGGAILLISGFVFIAWFRRFRPEQGTGAGVPAGLLKYLGKAPERRPRIPMKRPDNPASQLR